MPWLSYEFKDSRINQFAYQFTVRGVPHLVALDREGNVLSKNCTLDIIDNGPAFIEELI